MVRIIGAALVCAFALVGCSRPAEREAPGAERERTTDKARRDLARERKEAAEAREELAVHRREAAEARGEMRQATRDLEMAAQKACAGLTETEELRCPVAPGSIASVEDVANGVAVQLVATASESDVERRIECHKARREVARGRAEADGRTISTRATCFLDVSGTETDVSVREGRVAISVTTRDDGAQRDVRELARRGVPNAPPLRTTGGAVRR